MIEMSSIAAQVIFAEPTLIGFSGAALLHMLLWYYLHSWEFGFISILRNRIMKWKAYKREIYRNFVNDPAVEILGFNTDPSGIYVWNLSTAFHHGWGGALMFAGWYLELPWLWRHGMLTEVAGYDILDYMRMIWTVAMPPGPLPMSTIISSGSPYAILQIFHHSVGICAGSATILYFSEDPSFQWFGTVMLGGPFFVIGPGLLFNLYPPENKLPHVIDKGLQFAFWCHQRLYFFFTTAWVLLPLACADKDLPFLFKCAFAWACFALAVFNVALTPPLFQSFWSLLNSKQIHGTFKSGATGMVGSVATLEHLFHYTSLHSVVGMRLRSKKWAQRAKMTVQRRHIGQKK